MIVSSFLPIHVYVGPGMWVFVFCGSFIKDALSRLLLRLDNTGAWVIEVNCSLFVNQRTQNTERRAKKNLMLVIAIHCAYQDTSIYMLVFQKNALTERLSQQKLLNAGHFS